MVVFSVVGMLIIFVVMIFQEAYKTNAIFIIVFVIVML